MPDVAVTVVGGGVVGLAIAAELAGTFSPLVLLERNTQYGMETSSRNSEVIHAGLYYEEGSLKARLCVEGNRMLYALGEAHGIPMQRITKIVTASNEAELRALERLYARGSSNGAPLEMLTADQVHRLEPRVPSVGGLFSPTTGIISAHGLMSYFAAKAAAGGAVIQTRCAVAGIERAADGYRVALDERGERSWISSAWIINAAGLEADTIAGLEGIDVEAAGYRLHWSKGSYFALPGSYRGAISRLVYPAPTQHTLGVHAVLDLVGRLRFGPDIEYLPARVQDYSVDPSRRGAFAASVKRILPFVKEEDLTPDMAGIRPKLQGPAEGFRDYVIREESDRGLPRIINLIGIESPGLTASAAIAAYIRGLMV